MVNNKNEKMLEDALDMHTYKQANPKDPPPLLSYNPYQTPARCQWKFFHDPYWNLAWKQTTIYSRLLTPNDLVVAI